MCLDSIRSYPFIMPFTRLTHRRFISTINKAELSCSFPAHPIRCKNNLQIKDLLDVFSGKIVALRVSNFCSEIIIKQALEKLKNHTIIDYSNAEGVGKFQNLGMAYFEVQDIESKKCYYKQALPSITQIRKLFEPYLSPTDKIRIMLDEQWNQGASLLNLGEGPMFFGLLRATNAEILPHEDKLERDDPSSLSKIHYVAQAAFNCYLSIPEVGGDLQIWNISLNSTSYNCLRGNNYGISLSLLPPPKLNIHPNPGELVIFNPRYLHAVSPVPFQKTRISISGFILYQGERHPLNMWS